MTRRDLDSDAINQLATDASRMKLMVTNPGVHPELAHAAAHLCATGHEISYATSSSFSSTAPIPQRLRDGSLANRFLPATLNSDSVRRYGLTLEILRKLIPNRYPGLNDVALKSRNLYFQRRTVRALKAMSPHVLVAQSTAAHILFAACGPGTIRMLNYPLPHPTWMANELEHEAAINPAWAPFLQHQTPGRVDRRLFEEEVRLADNIIVASEFVRSTFIEQGTEPALLSTIPLASPLSVTHSAAMPRHADGPLQVAPDRLNIGFVGQITQRKGISYLMDACEAAASSIPLKLHLIGKPYNGIADHIARYQNTHLYGALRGTELGAAYTQMDVLLLPTLADGYGLVIAEALAHGVPVITSPRGAGADIVAQGVNGWIHHPRDVAGMAERLVELFETPEDQRMAMRKDAAARSTGQTWDQYGANVEHLLNRVSARRR